MIKILYILKKILSLEWVEKFSFFIGKKIYKGDNLNYEYAYQHFFFGIISQLQWMISGLVIAYFLECWFEYIFTCFGFCLLRRISGGLHLDTHAKCYYTTVFIMSLFGYISHLLTSHYLSAFLVSIGSILYIVWCVPKKSENTYEYTNEEEIKFRKRYCRWSVILYVINLVLIYSIYNPIVINYCNNALNSVFGIIKLHVEITEFILKQISTSTSVGMTLSVLMLTNWFEWILKKIWRIKTKS